MDNSTQPATPSASSVQAINSSQLTADNIQVPEAQASGNSTSSPTVEVKRIVPNRGGIPVAPLSPVAPPQVTQPVLPTEEPAPKVDSVSTDNADPVIPVAPQVNSFPSDVPIIDQTVSEILPSSVSSAEPSGSQADPDLVKQAVSAVSPRPLATAQSGPKSREHEPTPFPDVVKMNESEVQNEEVVVENELESLIEESPDTEHPRITDELKIAGVEHAIGDMAKPVIQPGKASYLPMTFDEAELTRKKYKWKDSIAWLSDLIVYHWKKLSFKNKK